MAFIKTVFPDLLMLAGTGSVTYGAWLIYAPLGFIVLGLFAIALALRLG